MTEYTIKKPWGKEVIWAKTDKYVAKEITIDPGHRMSLQYHLEKEETVRVIAGVLTIWTVAMTDGLETIVKDYFHKGDIYHISPKFIHRFGCEEEEPEPCIIMEVSTTELDDIVRLEDDYGRFGKE